MPWQDELLKLIMDVDAPGLAELLDRQGSKAINAKLERQVVGGHTLYVLAEKVYKEEGALRETLGGDYKFEREEPRALLHSWLEMLGTRGGDTMLHLILRVNGVDARSKAECVVEFIGRGAQWEVANNDGALPSMVDGPAFKEAFFRLLPAWRAHFEAEKQADYLEATAKRREDNRRKQRQAVEAEKERAKRNWENAKARVEQEIREDRQRARYVHKLEGAIEKLERREQRLAQLNPAWTELMVDLRQLPGRFERWLKYDLKLFGS